VWKRTVVIVLFQDDIMLAMSFQFPRFRRSKTLETNGEVTTINDIDTLQ
jgi:hypothetical protein